MPNLFYFQLTNTTAVDQENTVQFEPTLLKHFVILSQLY